MQRRRALCLYNLRIAGCYFQPEKEDKSTKKGHLHMVGIGLKIKINEGV